MNVSDGEKSYEEKESKQWEQSFQVGPSSVATLNKVVRQGSLIWFRLTRNLKEVREPAFQVFRERASQTGNSKCKGLEAEECLACLRNGKETSVPREGIKGEREREKKEGGGREGGGREGGREEEEGRENRKND